MFSDIFTRLSLPVRRDVSNDDAKNLFGMFKPLEGTKAYKSFLASGATDDASVGVARISPLPHCETDTRLPLQKAQAQVASVKEMTGIMTNMGKFVTNPTQFNSTINSFLDEVSSAVIGHVVIFSHRNACPLTARPGRTRS
jgi:hypothetical protein